MNDSLLSMMSADHHCDGKDTKPLYSCKQNVHSTISVNHKYRLLIYFSHIPCILAVFGVWQVKVKRLSPVTDEVWCCRVKNSPK